jgi:Tfp pilus assembly protein FimT
MTTDDERSGAAASAARPRHGRHERGMTFVEVLVALACTGLLLTAGLLAAEWALPAWRVREATGTLASTLRAARTRALTQRTAVSVDFDAGAGRYALLEDADPAELRVVELTPGVAFVHPDGEETVTLEPPGTTDTSALFNPRGRLLSTATPGYVYFGDQGREVYMRVGANVAGEVFVQTWRGGDWR